MKKASKFDLGKTLLWVFLCWVNTAGASPSSDLGSPSQEVRDAAAKILRATYTPPSRTNWDSVIASIKVGTPKTNVLELLRTFNAQPEGCGGGGGIENELYRLDELWLLECTYHFGISNLVFAGCALRQQLRFISVEPPTNFTGIWTVYYINGQKSGQGNFKEGRPEGESIRFYPDGSKALVNHSTNGVLNGEETGFFPSGRVKYRGLYEAGSQVGKWIWYNEDGSVKSKKELKR
jgi:hypothetical protein